MSSNQPHTGAAPAVPLLTAAVITLIAIVLIAGFIVIGAVTGIVPLYAGFLLLWYWTTVTHSQLSALAPATLGGLVGAGMSYLLQTGVAAGSAPIVVLALGLMVVALFLVIAGRLATVCNASTMLFVTVFNAPVIQKGEDFRQVIVATALGMVWFGVTIGLLSRLAPQPAPSAEAPSAEAPAGEPLPA